MHVLGIRHHGPGSAASVLGALEAIQPEAVLIEAPADAEDVLRFAAGAQMRPPVALLLHDAKDPTLARFFPFAEYSPEWQAIRFAVERGVALRAIDLPAGVAFADERRRREEAESAVAASLDASEEDPGQAEPDRQEPDTEDADDARRDPLQVYAELAGHASGEEWWDAVVERSQSAPLVFRAIADAMAALREGEDPELEDENAVREAHMTRALWAALDAFEGPIAVVCGAWHAPALERPMTKKRATALLKGRRGVRVAATWIPWTEQRLAARSGYGAGVSSPGWYAHAWSSRADATSSTGIGRWMARSARLLRDEGWTAATSSAIDATRLAESLAAVRGRARAGLDEVQDASLAALCHGDDVALRLIEAKLVIGARIGSVDPSVPMMPLAEDFARQLRRLRLKREALERDVSVDVRTDAGRARSTLFHRLDLIGVRWAVLRDGQAGRGTYREVWRLEWVPEHEVQLAEALRFGTTVEAAAAGAAQSLARDAGRELTALAGLVQRCLLCELPSSAEACITALQRAAVDHAYLPDVLSAIPPLVDVLRYGEARDLPKAAIGGLAQQLFAQVLAGLHLAAQGLDESEAAAFASATVDLDRAVRSDTSGSLDREAWQAAVLRAVHDERAAARVRGAAARIAYDDELMAPSEVDGVIGRALRGAAEPEDSSAWLEGFLGADAQVLLHDRALLGRIDAWMVEQEADAFEELLPLLRRSFSNFDPSERAHMMGAASALGAGAPAQAEPGESVLESSHAELGQAVSLALELLGMQVTGSAPGRGEGGAT